MLVFDTSVVGAPAFVSTPHAAGRLPVDGRSLVRVDVPGAQLNGRLVVESHPQ